MKTHADKKFEAQAKNTAKMFDEVGDPLIFEGIKTNESGKKEAFFHDSKCVYCVDEDLEFNYVCKRQHPAPGGSGQLQKNGWDC